MIFSSPVPREFDKVALIEYLVGRFTYLDRDGWLGYISQGRILCNGVVAQAQCIVAVNDTVSFDSPIECDMSIVKQAVVFEDAWIFGIDKPGNLPVHQAGKNLTNTLIYQLRFRSDPPYPDAGIINRLDRETSGVVLVARQREYLAPMHALFAQGAIEKEYVALVKGEVAQGLVIDEPLGPNAGSRIAYKQCVNPQGKASRTEVTASQRIGSNFSLIRVKPHTGRTHQIRVHLAWAGFPIVGDKLYALDEETYCRWRESPAILPPELLFYRQALHCASLRFKHPFTAENCAVEAPLPAEIGELCLRLEKLP